MKFKTVIGTVALSSERKAHIIQHHPIMENYLGNLGEVLEKPDEVRYSNYNASVLLFYRYFDTIEDGKYVVGVINQAEKEVKTAYLSQRIKIGRGYAEKE